MNTYDEVFLEEVVLILKEKPCTVRELAEHYKKTPRTIKRWFAELRRRGHRVVRDGVASEAPYAIVVAQSAIEGG